MKWLRAQVMRLLGRSQPPPPVHEMSHLEQRSDAALASADTELRRHERIMSAAAAQRARNVVQASGRRD